MFLFRSIITGTFLLAAILVIGPEIADKFAMYLPAVHLGSFRYLGAPLILLGAPLSLYSAYLILIPGKGKAVPYESEQDFTPSGPYKYSRNPFMLGVLITLWGEVIFFSSVAMALYAGVVTIAIFFWVCCCEEPSLEERYGEEYREHRRNTPRWLPTFHKKT